MEKALQLTSGVYQNCGKENLVFSVVERCKAVHWQHYNCETAHLVELSED